MQYNITHNHKTSSSPLSFSTLLPIFTITSTHASSAIYLRLLLPTLLIIVISFRYFPVTTYDVGKDPERYESKSHRENCPNPGASRNSQIWRFVEKGHRKYSLDQELAIGICYM
jgi:hypothetical protein